VGNERVSRRTFLAGSSVLAGASLARTGLPALLAVAQTACTARDEGAAFETLSDAEARELEAIAARILPATDTPGAREAGVVYFFDRSFGSIMQEQLAFARQGLTDFNAGIPAAFPGAGLFSDLDAADQDRYLGAREDTGFFGFMRFMTLAGFFGMSSYGGNRDHVGWQLLGIDPRQHAWQPPFGHYDAEYMRAAADVDAG
jgi:gluconate 2-dehydrogenase gamma chain